MVFNSIYWKKKHKSADTQTKCSINKGVFPKVIEKKMGEEQLHKTITNKKLDIFVFFRWHQSA